ncbi:MAG: hypothetical protein NVSMB19_15880 [Vulcanimicrobiaceae bacterium]
MTALPAIAPNSRTIITGPTGCGKTELAKELLRGIGADARTPARNVVVVDAKHLFSWGDPHERYSRIATTYGALVQQLVEIEETGLHEPIIYRPIDPTDYPANDLVARLALARRHTMLYYDELSLTAGSGDPRYTSPQWARAMVTGRQLGVGVMNSTQRPVGIPKIARTEADHRFTFYLRDHDDRETVDRIFGGGIPWDTLADEEFSFVYASDHTLRGRAPLQPMRLTLSSATAAA